MNKITLLLFAALFCKLFTGCEMGATGEVGGDVDVEVSVKPHHYHCAACGYDWYGGSLGTFVCPRCESPRIEIILDEMAGGGIDG